MDFIGGIYLNNLIISIKKKSIPLTTEPMEGAVVCNTTLFLLRMKRFRVRIPAEVNNFYYLRYLQNHYYKHYKYSEFDAPEIHDAALKF